MRRLLDGFYGLLLIGAAIALIAAFGCVVVGVAGRQFGFTVPGLDAYAGYAIAAALFLALPETLRRGGHIRIGLVTSRLPQRARWGVELLCLAIAAVLAGALAWASGRLVWFSHLTHDVSQAADATPLWIPQLVMVVGSGGLLLALLDALQSHLRGRRFIETGPGDDPAGTAE
jgi:TRAP-type C4-dicarboxylate transport system permease small subunit